MQILKMYMYERDEHHVMGWENHHPAHQPPHQGHHLHHHHRHNGYAGRGMYAVDVTDSPSGITPMFSGMFFAYIIHIKVYVFDERVDRIRTARVCTAEMRCNLVVLYCHQRTRCGVGSFTTVETDRRQLPFAFVEELYHTLHLLVNETHTEQLCRRSFAV